MTKSSRKDAKYWLSEQLAEDKTMVQFISHTTESISYIDSIRIALEGGCHWVQLRMKDADTSEIVANAIEARRLCDRYGARLILDDHVELVKETGADGVHLGKNDMPLKEARALLGDRYIIGGTANTFEDIERHYRDGADYIGCGPFRFTTTKKNLSPILGLEGYREIVRKMKSHGIAIPVVAIGGITEGDIPDIMGTGVDGIAISGFILNSEDPVKAMKQTIEITEKYTDK